MRIFVDVDGTITDKQTSSSFFKESCKKRQDVILACRKAGELGHEVFIWSDLTAYAKRVAEELHDRHGCKIAGAFGKPQMMVDNEQQSFRKKLKRRVILPEDFVAKAALDFEDK